MEEDLQFITILNEHNIVVNKALYPLEVPEGMTVCEFTLTGYNTEYKCMEYSEIAGVANNMPEIGYKYVESLNAFIPPRQNDTYVLNEETFVWEPDPNLEYDLYGDGLKYKWTSNGWILYN